MADWLEQMRQDDPDDAPVLRRRRLQVDTQMDMTPMIDATFLLLIFFTVGATIEPDTAVELPPARYGTTVDPLHSVIFTVASQGEGQPAAVYLADGKVGPPLSTDPNELTDQVRQAIEAGLAEGRSNVLIKAERGVRHRDVSRVATAVGGLEGVSLHVAVLESEF